MIKIHHIEEYKIIFLSSQHFSSMINANIKSLSSHSLFSVLSKFYKNGIILHAFFSTLIFKFFILKNSYEVCVYVCVCVCIMCVYIRDSSIRQIPCFSHLTIFHRDLSYKYVQIHIIPFDFYSIFHYMHVL